MIDHREASAADAEQIQKWIDADPAHAGIIKADFWLPAIGEDGKALPGTKRLAVTDEKGVAFYIRVDNVMRVSIQFPPDSERDPERTKMALTGSFRVLAANGKRLGYSEMIFDSVSKSLIKFFSKFGFSEMKDTFKVDL